MNGVTLLCAAAISAATLALTIKKHNAELSMILSICSCVTILIWSFTNAAQAISRVSDIAERTGVSSEYLAVIFKAMGICFLTEFAYDCCKDAGQSALAGNTLLAGKILVIITALPLFEKILDISTELIGI